MAVTKQVPVVLKEGKIRVFVCPFEGCKKESSRKYNIQAHMRIHTEQTPYRCDHDGCEMTFKWRSSLVNHERYHRREAVVDDTSTVESKIQDEGCLRRLQSDNSAVYSDVSDRAPSDDQKEQFYVAVILAEGFSQGGCSGADSLLQCPRNECKKFFNSRDNLDAHSREHCEHVQ